MRRIPTHRRRRGAIVVLVAASLMLLLAMVAFAVDIGAVLTVKTDMQRAADAGALAAAQRLAPDEDGDQNQQAAIAAAHQLVASNMQLVGAADFQVDADDIDIGSYNAETIYAGNAQIQNQGQANVVRVTLRRDGVLNARAPLFFGRVLGFQDAALQVSATATLPSPNLIFPGTAVLPFAFNKSDWDALAIGDTFVIYGDGKMTDGNGDELPGNWGTLDIGSSNNSTSDLREQIEQGLRQEDLQALYDEGRIAQNTHFDSRVPVTLDGDPGLSSGMKCAVIDGEGKQYLIPLFDTVGAGGGDNSSYHVIAWAAATLEDSRWHGSKHTWVRVTKSPLYDGHLSAATGSLSSGTPTIIDGYGAPMLIR